MTLVTLNAVGDIMLGCHPLRAIRGLDSAPTLDDLSRLQSHISEETLAADIMFGNLEAVLSNRGCD